jgi:hypothetical protein
LRDHEDLAADLPHRAVHRAVLVTEDPQSDDLRGECACIVVPILASDAKQDEKTETDGSHDLALDGDRRFSDAGDDGSHGRASFEATTERSFACMRAMR